MDLILKDNFILPELPELKRQNAQVYLDYVFNARGDVEDFDGDGS